MTGPRSFLIPSARRRSLLAEVLKLLLMIAGIAALVLLLAAI